MLMLAIALLFLGAGASLARRYMRRRPGIPPGCHDLAGAIAILALLGAAYAALRNFGIDMVERRWDVFGVCGLLAATGSLYQRSRAGKMLLDLGPRPGRAWYLVLAGIMFLGGVYDLQRGDKAAPGEFCLAVPCLAYGIARRQLREAGIWIDVGLTRWPGIAGYLVEDDGTVRVKLKYSLWRPKLRVPGECREEFFTLLEERAQLRTTTLPPN